MPGRCFSYPCRSKAFPQNQMLQMCRDDSGPDSFSSMPLKGDISSKRSSWSGCSMSGCSPPIPNLRDVIHASTKLLMSSKQSSSSPCSSPRNSDYIHQSPTGEYYYRAPLKVKHAAKVNNNDNNNHKRHQVELGPKFFKGAGPRTGDLAGDNMCLVKGCCECSMASCDISSEVADHGSGASLIHINGSSGSTSHKCVCPKCGETFYRNEALELHQIARHAVSQLGSGNSSLNVIEMIFKTSWLTKETPCGKIERILKIDNTQRAIGEFEEYRNRVKERHGTSDDMKNKTHPDERCLADGNELLRFFATSLTCSLGANGSSSNLCSMSACNVCNLVRWGFAANNNNNNNKTLLGDLQTGIYTTARSGKAHQLISQEEKENRTLHGKHAMLVCRVIAGRIQKLAAGDRMPPALSLPLTGYDSVARDCGRTANLDEVTVFDPKAVLPCFVVIYTI